MTPDPLRTLKLNTDQITSPDFKKPTELGRLLLDYFQYRADLLNTKQSGLPIAQTLLARPGNRRDRPLLGTAEASFILRETEELTWDNAFSMRKGTHD